MRARALFAGTVGILLLTIATTPAAAKWMIAEAHVSGPGLDAGGLRIAGPATEGLWDSGLDVIGGLDDTRPDSVTGLGLTAAELGLQYVVIYRVEAGTKATEIVRQELYPYAKGGPVSYTPSGQRIAEGLPWGGAISAGWYQSPLKFFHLLVDEGLPETRPVVADPQSVRDTVPAARPTPWGWIALALAALLAVVGATFAIRGQRST